jgi:uncharacterized protein YeaO (DUF488 family)
MAIKLKRVYEPRAEDDGTRILVERLWPRGLTKDRAAVDLWLKEVAPSPELRKWYGHDTTRWEPFRQRYLDELRQNKEAVAHLKELADRGSVTFVYAARDEEHNSALILKNYLESNER